MGDLSLLLRTTTQHSKKCAAASSRGAGASLVTQKEKVGSRPLSRNTAGTGRTPPGRTARSCLHHVARLAGARSGAVASSAVSQGLTTTSIWPWFPDVAFALANVGFMPTADVLKAGPQATSGQAFLFARATRSTLSVRHIDASPPIRLELDGIIAEEWLQTKSKSATRGEAGGGRPEAEGRKGRSGTPVPDLWNSFLRAARPRWAGCAVSYCRGRPGKLST